MLKVHIIYIKRTNDIYYIIVIEQLSILLGFKCTYIGLLSYINDFALLKLTWNKKKPCTRLFLYCRNLE